jgi:microcystin-dependent protein
MAQPYVGEIRMFAGNFAPAGWMFCDGSVLPISENETLFQLLGTTYGGDGESTFALPDLRGRVPLHFGNGLVQAETGGVESVTLTTAQLPAHQHLLLASTNVGGGLSPANSVYAQVPPGGVQVYTQDNTVQPTPTPLAPVGGSQPHENRQPLLALSFIISLYGIFPSPS